MESKTCLITGGGTGIGRAISIALAEKGINVAINYSRSKREALDTKVECEKHGVKAIVYQADVSNDIQARQMVKYVIEEFGKLDILVNNAGVTNHVPMHDLEGLIDEYWDRAMDINVKGTFYVSRAASEELKRQKGCIVNTASVAGILGKGSSIAYAASKAAVINLTKSLAHVLAPEVRVNSISPGAVETRWIAGREEQVKKLTTAIPLDRLSQPEEIAEVAISLILGSKYMTGQNLVVDGGLNM